jgi:aspartate racemase
MKRLGVIGGLGPETGCTFCLNVNNKVIKKTRIQPDIFMQNVPIPESILQKLAHGSKPEEILALLSQSVTKLNIIGSDIIAIPCNTVHSFIDQLRFISKVPIISIIEEVAKECVNKGSKVIGLMASTTSIREKLHSIELHKKNIMTIVPREDQQEIISKTIVKIITNKITKKDKEKLIEIIDDLRNRGADTIMLACTDLRIVISDSDTDIPIIDSTSVLENAAAQAIME